MANIATLAVSITANTDKFVGGISKSAAALTSFVGKMAPSIALGNILSSTLSNIASSAQNMVKETFQGIDATAKLADRLGFTTEQLTGLQHAANLSGVSSESLRIGFEKMLKTLTPGQDPSAAIMRIADEVKGMKDPAERAQYAMTKFGKSGQELIPLLSGGSEALRKMAEENERLGGSFSRIDAAKVEAANDAVSNLWQSIQGIANTVAVELAPFVKAAADSFVVMATSGAGIKANTKNAFDGIVLSIAKSLDYLDYFKSGWYSLESIINEVAGFLVDAFGEAFNLFGDMIELQFIAPLRRINEVVPTDALTNLINGFDEATSKGTRLFKDMSAIIAKDAEDAADKATKAYGNFLNGTNSQRAIQGLRNIQIEQEKLAQQAAANAASNNIPGGYGYELGAQMADLAEFANKEEAKALEKSRNDLEEWAKQAVKSMRTPWQVFDEESQKADKALREGIYSQKQYQDVLDHLAKEREKALGKLDFSAIEKRLKESPAIAGEFKQFDLSRINVRGLSSGTKKQEVKAPEMEDLLKKQLETSKSIDSGIKNLDLGFA